MNEKQHTKVYEFAEKAENFAGLLEERAEVVLSTVSDLVGEVVDAINQAAEEARMKADQIVVDQVIKEESQVKWDKVTDDVSGTPPKYKAPTQEQIDRARKIIDDLFRGKGPL